jgi:hypothetical protein
MSFIKREWKKRIVEFPSRRLLLQTDKENAFDVKRDEGNIVQNGDSFSANNMNDLENRIFTETASLNEGISEVNKQVREQALLLPSTIKTDILSSTLIGQRAGAKISIAGSIAIINLEFRAKTELTVGWYDVCELPITSKLGCYVDVPTRYNIWIRFYIAGGSNILKVYPLSTMAINSDVITTATLTM